MNQVIPKMEELEKHLSEAYGGWVKKGGAWRPSNCKARVKVCYMLLFDNTTVKRLRESFLLGNNSFILDNISLSWE